MLSNVCVGEALLQQVDGAIEEALATHSFVDINVRLLSLEGNLFIVVITSPF